MDYKYNAIILEKYDIAEIDRIYTLYTLEAGKIRVIGKGVRRPNAKLAGNLEPITQAEVFIAKTKGTGKITGAIVTHNFNSVKSTLVLAENVFYALKIFKKLIHDQEKDENIFYLLESFLESAEDLKGKENIEEKAKLITLGFLYKLLSELGYKLEAERCADCGQKLKPAGNYFSAVRGGVLCPNCLKNESRRVAISSESIKILRIFLNNKIKNLNKLKVSPKEIKILSAILKDFLQWIAN